MTIALHPNTDDAHDHKPASEYRRGTNYGWASRNFLLLLSRAWSPPPQPESRNVRMQYTTYAVNGRRIWIWIFCLNLKSRPKKILISITITGGWCSFFNCYGDTRRVQRKAASPALWTSLVWKSWKRPQMALFLILHTKIKKEAAFPVKLEADMGQETRSIHNFELDWKIEDGNTATHAEGHWHEFHWFPLHWTTHGELRLLLRYFILAGTEKLSSFFPCEPVCSILRLWRRPH